LQMEAVYEKQYDIRYHELDCNGNIKPLALVHYLQDTAGMHAARLGVSVPELHALGLTWVLSRLHLQVKRYHRADETLTVRTWPSTRQNLFTCREFLIMDQTGDITARATTTWAVVKLATRRPVRLDSHLPRYVTHAERAIQNSFDALPPFSAGNPDSQLPFRVLRTDLDINRHVNNAIYISWALEAVPDSIASGCLTELEVVYRSEALYGEQILSSCSATPDDNVICCLHQITNRSDNRELVSLRTHWRNPTDDRSHIQA